MQSEKEAVSELTEKYETEINLLKEENDSLLARVKELESEIITVQETSFHNQTVLEEVKEELEQKEIEIEKVEEVVEELTEINSEILEKVSDVEELATEKAIKIVSEIGLDAPLEIEEEPTTNVLETLKKLKGAERAKFYQENKHVIFQNL